MFKINPLSNMFKKSVPKFYVNCKKEDKIKCYWKPELSKRVSQKKKRSKKKEYFLSTSTIEPEYVHNEYKNMFK